jgi:hypothetical protein
VEKYIFSPGRRFVIDKEIIPPPPQVDMFLPDHSYRNAKTVERFR